MKKLLLVMTVALLGVGPLGCQSNPFGRLCGRTTTMACEPVCDPCSSGGEVIGGDSYLGAPMITPGPVMQ